MNIQELTTWDRLLQLNLDASDSRLPFSARLARDNGWTRAFAAKAIEEYRKFCFLAVHAGHPVTPSDGIDQVWHLHLTYSRHYWDTLCRDTLGRPLHHGPTEGGAAEGRKFHDWYENTLASYRRYFGEPPESLWPTARERFDERHEFVRIDRRDVVTLDRVLLKRGAVTSLAAGALVAVAHALAQPNGGTSTSYGLAPWVVLLTAVLAIAFLAAAAKRRRVRSARARKRRSDDGAVAAGGVTGYGAPSKSKDMDGDGNGDGGTDGGAAGCGSSGCGGGGGCGGGS